MNISKPLTQLSRPINRAIKSIRRCLPATKSITFDEFKPNIKLSAIRVINLDREPDRWRDIKRELRCLLDFRGTKLDRYARRFAAVDAKTETAILEDESVVYPFYTLRDQLFVEPQPHALPDIFDLEKPVRMSKAEVAVAHSHIQVWQAVASGQSEYVLILEDDVSIDRKFASYIDDAWREMEEADSAAPAFDIFYVSYKEALHGAHKELLSKSVFRPERGIWFLSGYILSKKGAQALLNLLPCRGPIDLWINHHFSKLDVRGLRRSSINQRRDLSSTNSYSILPLLSQIGVINTGDASLFHKRLCFEPVFAFGRNGDAMSSLAMALSMLGYTCLSNCKQLDSKEQRKLLNNESGRIFNAYVNVECLEKEIGTLVQSYPNAKFILYGSTADPITEIFLQNNILDDADVLRLDDSQSWKDLCEHLHLAPPLSDYPRVQSETIRTITDSSLATNFRKVRRFRFDPSPWIAKANHFTSLPYNTESNSDQSPSEPLSILFQENFEELSCDRWLKRTDTFPGNLGLFRCHNVSETGDGAVELIVADESLGVREYSAAALTTKDQFLYGRFEATIKASKIPGLITGFFLHRNSPRQEIDIEILGNRPDKLLVNVFYNPGSEGAKFDYGYRGTPVLIDLGFDASEAAHDYAIEWSPDMISWYVDNELVYARRDWCPTPIPHLPMKLHVNHWPSRSQQLAGRLSVKRLPSNVSISNISVYSFGKKHIGGYRDSMPLFTKVG